MEEIKQVKKQPRVDPKWALAGQSAVRNARPVSDAQ